MALVHTFLGTWEVSTAPSPAADVHLTYIRPNILDCLLHLRGKAGALGPGGVSHPPETCNTNILSVNPLLYV